MAAATNLAQLFDFEGNFEDAIQGILSVITVPAYIDEQAVKMALANAAVSFDMGPAMDELTQIPAPSNWPADTPPPQEYFRYTGTFDIRVEVALDDNAATVADVATKAGQIRGLVRAALMRCVAPFNDTNLPLYRVSDIRPAGTSTGVEQPRNLFFTSIRFTVWFAIQPGAWPAWIET